MSFTILGGQGFVGKALARHIVAAGGQVWVPTKEEISDGTVCSRPLGHVVYAIGRTADFRSRLSDTVEAHVSLLDRLLSNTHWESWLFLSSTRVYGANVGSRPANEDDRLSVFPSLEGIYDISKLLGESLCLARRETTCRVARLSNIFGPGMPDDTFLASIAQEAVKSGQVVIGENPASMKDYMPIQEVTRLLEAIAVSGRHRLYNVASGRSITHALIADRVAQYLGAQVTFTSGGPTRRLPEIDISRIVGEFGEVACNLDDTLNAFLSSFQEWG